MNKKQLLARTTTIAQKAAKPLQARGKGLKKVVNKIIDAPINMVRRAVRIERNVQNIKNSAAQETAKKNSGQ